MPTLSEKLKALGVSVGMEQRATPKHHNEYTIDQVIPGRVELTELGRTFIFDQFFSQDYSHSPRAINQHLVLSAPREAIAQWANEPLVAKDDPTTFAFLDTETSGLSGGTGTYAFLVGVGRFDSGKFHLAQYFMRDPSEEPAMLTALEAFLAPCTILVTFNGKAFDVPLMNTRYQLQGWISPIADLIQIDLLHLARRIWRDKLPSRTLGNLEHQILGTVRSAQEVPGWMIPQMYFDYLRSGDARPMENVFYHNAMDVLSLATLMDHCAHLLSAPQAIRSGEEIEQVALGRIYEDMGELDLAIEIYNNCLKKEIPQELYWDTVRRLSFIYKKQNKMPDAIHLWELAAENSQVYACVELAKIQEHNNRNYKEAVSWTEKALAYIHTPDASPIERFKWQKELEHRLQRIKNKVERNSPGHPSASKDEK